MDKTYWLRRNLEAMHMASGAATAQSRLIHYDLAGRYSVKAAACLPFLLADKGPATPGEREALRLHVPPFRPAPSSGQRFKRPTGGKGQ